MRLNTKPESPERIAVPPRATTAGRRLTGEFPAQILSTGVGGIRFGPSRTDPHPVKQNTVEPDEAICDRRCHRPQSVFPPTSKRPGEPSTGCGFDVHRSSIEQMEPIDVDEILEVNFPDSADQGEPQSLEVVFKDGTRRNFSGTELSEVLATLQHWTPPTA